MQFYKHEVDWANRLILGDSLQVMSSLAHRENLAGKAQMIYIDPPYGIGFGSNFQPEVGTRDIKDGKDGDLTREAETVRAYRDTWHLGVHSYSTYLRDRLQLAKELLADTGSIFVQINDDNLHVVRALLDTVFGGECYLSTITFQKTSGSTTLTVPATSDYLLWYARKQGSVRFSKLYMEASPGEEGAEEYTRVERSTGERASLGKKFDHKRTELPIGDRVFATDSIVSKGGGSVDVAVGNRQGGFLLSCGSSRHWKPGVAGIQQLWKSERLLPQSGLRIYKRYFGDFPFRELTHVWTDTRGEDDPDYVVQTSTKVVERCMLMTTDPGDLVIDPTCGSGTTAYVAEQWGRRWITTDTSRVAISIARQRLLTASFNHYKFRPLSDLDRKRNPVGRWLRDPRDHARAPQTFSCKVAPHIKLGAIAQNVGLVPIFARHEPVLESCVKSANMALQAVSDEVRTRLRRKLEDKQRANGKKSITDADRRRWVLPPDNRDLTDKLTLPADFAGWYEWEVPFDTDPDWPKPLQDAVTAYRKAWRAKMDEVNKCIEDDAEQEELLDDPIKVPGVTRVSGPFTVEGVMPEELALTEDGIVDLTPNDGGDDSGPDPDAQNRSAYLKEMTDAILRDGVLFPNNQKRMFSRVEPLYEGHTLAGIHAEAAWEGEDDATVAICFGPQYGPVSAYQVEELIRATKRYAHLVIAGFSFDPEATAIIELSQHPKLKIHMAHIRPDMNPGMRGLLKDTPNSQLFTVFGMPAVDVAPAGGDEWQVTLEGVSIYNPVENTTTWVTSGKVAAWFLDSDFDGRCFCICQAFFPDQDAWEKIARSLGSAADPEAFAAFKGTTSLAFKKGKHARIAVKVIDPRGNEVMTVRKLEG